MTSSNWASPPFMNLNGESRFPLSGILVCLLSVGALANSSPVVSSITVSQRADASKLVDIYYRLSDGDGDECIITLQISNDRGSTWTIPATTAQGDIGPGVNPRSGLHIVWDPAVDAPGQTGCNFKIRITANDGNSADGLVLIPGGTFSMGDSFNEGDSDERPVHTVSLDSFYMGKYEITNRQYCDYLNSAISQGLITVTSGVVYRAGSGTSYPYFDTHSYSTYSQIDYSGGVFSVRTKGGRSMVNDAMVEVSWYGAAAYCNWRSQQEGKEQCYNLSTWNCDFNKKGYRLPTEAEWEYAARGGLAARRFPWGDTISHTQANYWSTGSYMYDISPTRGPHPDWNDGVQPSTSPVGSFPVTAYGLYDMAGNVWELCNDWYDSYPSSLQTNPRGPLSGSSRVTRGGFWWADAQYCRVADRNRDEPDATFRGWGFRIVLPHLVNVNIGQAESSPFCLDYSAPSLPGEGQVKVGQLIITGDVIHPVSSGWEVSGNVMVNDTVRLTGTVTANTATLKISGSGQIWIDDVPRLGDIMLYDGDWQFDGQTAATTTINTFFSALDLSGMEVRCTYIGIVDTAVRVQGYVELPAELGGGKVDIDGEHFIELSIDEGLIYNLVIENNIDVNVGGFDFTAQDSVVHLSNTVARVALCRIYGVYQLRGFLGDVIVNLDPDEGNYFSVTRSGDTVQVDIVGSISIGEVIIVPPDVVYAKDLYLDMDTVAQNYYASGTIGFPVGVTHVDAAGELEILGGYFNSASLAAEFDPPVGVLYSPTPPPVPIVYLYRIGGGIYNLSPLSDKAVIIMIDGGFIGGPEFFGNNLVELDLTGTLDLSGSIRGDAFLRLGNFGENEAILTGIATVIIDLHNGLYLELEIRKDYEGQEFLYLGGQAAVDLNNNFTGSLRGSVVVPRNAPVIGAILGGQGASAQAYAQALDDGDSTNDYLAVGFRIVIGMPWPLEPIRLEPVIEIGLANGQINWLGSWNRIKEVTFPGVKASGRVHTLGLTAPMDFEVLPGADYVIFRASWDANTTDLHLTRPDDRDITPDNVDDFKNAVYYTNYDVNEVFYVIKDPMAGTWNLFLSEEIGIGDYTFQQLQGSEAPTIVINEPSVDTSESSVTITWDDLDSDDDARISLYYDTDHQGTDGTLIIADISENDANNFYVWDTNCVPVGAYYVYAVITDGNSLPAISYSVGRVHVSDPDALLPPADLAAAPTGVPGELLLTWLPVIDPNLHHYNVYYTADAAGEGMEEVRGAGNRTTVVLNGLLPGETYRIAAASVDDSNNIGPLSEPIIVTLSQDSNHTPLFVGGILSQAIVGQLYQSQIMAEDLDGDRIAFSLVVGEPNIPDPPDGLTVSSDGLLEWIPEPDQVGNHTFAIMLDDANATDQQVFTIYVDDENAGNHPPEILSEAPPLSQAGAIYTYQVVAKDPDPYDLLSYELLAAPNDASVSADGLIQWSVPVLPGRYEFLVKVTDTAGSDVLQRITVQNDLEGPVFDADDWGTLSSTAPNSITVEAAPAPDATGLVEYSFEIDGNEVGWQRMPQFTVVGLSPNTEHIFRVKFTDAAPIRNETDWTEPNSFYTLAETPPAPNLVSTDINSLEVQVSPGSNPATTTLALYNASTSKWIDLSGEPSDTSVWAESTAWDTVEVSGLAVDTTYHVQCKARNEDGIETDLSPVLTTKTDAPNSVAEVTADTDWLYENSPNSVTYQVDLSAAFVNDPYSNTEYTFTWQTLVNPTTAETLVLVGGGEPNSPTATYAAPEDSNNHPSTYSVICTITGRQTGNSVTKTVNIDVLVRSDFNANRIVDFGDFAILANYWLQNDPLVDIAPPPSGDGKIDYLDLALLVDHWLEGIAP